MDQELFEVDSPLRDKRDTSSRAQWALVKSMQAMIVELKQLNSNIGELLSKVDDIRNLLQESRT